MKVGWTDKKTKYEKVRLAPLASTAGWIEKKIRSVVVGPEMDGMTKFQVITRYVYLEKESFHNIRLSLTLSPNCSHTPRSGSGMTVPLRKL